MLSQILQIPALKIIGGLLLFAVAAKLYKQFRDQAYERKHHTSGRHLWHALGLIIITDISMSMDNILAVVGAAGNNLVALGVGIVVSIVLMGTIATYIAKLLGRYPRIQRLGFILIVLIAFKMLLAGVEVVIPEGIRATLLGVGAFIGCLVIIYLHSRHLSVFEEEEVAPYLYRHAPFLVTFLLMIIALLLVFGKELHVRLDTHPALQYTIFLCVFLLGLEMASLERVKRRHRKGIGR